MHVSDKSTFPRRIENNIKLLQSSLIKSVYFLKNEIIPVNVSKTKLMYSVLLF